jgi:transposase
VESPVLSNGHAGFGERAGETNGRKTDTAPQPDSTCYTGAVHALCGAHVLRELIYVTDTATGRTQAMAQQAITALLGLKSLADQARASGSVIDPATRATHAHLLRSAALVEISATADRTSNLQAKHHALFCRLRDRWDDYLRFTADLSVPFDNNRAEQTIRMPKLRIKVSGSMRTLTGAQDFTAIRSYIATATRHRHGMLDVLIKAAAGRPWIPATT